MKKGNVPQSEPGLSLRPIYNRPVVPEEGEHYKACKHKPLTREEFKCDFRTAIFMKHPDSQACLQALLEYKLASTIQIYSRYFYKTNDGRLHPGWRENLKKLADAGIYIQNIGVDYRLPEDEKRMLHEFLVETFGEKYIGMKGDSELDGGYTSGWCWGEGPYVDLSGMRQEPSPDRSRARAHQEYDRVLDVFYSLTYHHAVSISSLGYGCHYAAEHGARMLGIEAEESLPSDTLLWSFCRGASKQYDLLTAVSISPSSRWGQKWYSRDGRNVTSGDGISGPDYGPSEGLSKREWYLGYMYGTSVLFFSAGIFNQTRYDGKTSGDYEPFIMVGGLNQPGWGLLEANLTPMGRLHVEGQEFAVDHPVRGTPYMPVALILDYDHGWNPPRHHYRRDEDHVWGNIPYSRLDYQIDNFFRWVYPDYELASYYRDERGYITNTPFGDLFEVILSNASAGSLEKYRAAVLLGEIQVEARDGLAGRLTEFVEGGGILVVGTEQWADIPASLSGAEVEGVVRSFSGEIVSWDQRAFQEEPFQYRSARETTGEVLLKTPEGDPLVIRNRAGKGSVFLVTVQGWGAEEKRHRFLNGVTHVIAGLFADLNLVEISGRPITYAVNVTDREDELIVTLCNNSPDLPWEGRVIIRGEEIQSFEGWLGHSEAGIEDGALRCGVPANDVRIYKLKAGRDFLPLVFRQIDWARLGVGVPENDFQESPARKPSHL